MEAKNEAKETEMRPELRIPNSFPPTMVREAFNRDWIWPVGDHFGWSHPYQHWHEIGAAIETVFDFVSGDYGWAGSTVLQAGGCCGMYPWLLSSYFEKVLTFEMEPFNFACLVANCSTPRIIASNMALSNRNGMVGIDRRSAANCGNHHVVMGNEVPAIQIDNLGLRRLDALLLDVEGHENEALQGGFSTIRKCKPRVIILESVDQTTNLMLEELGYKPSSELQGYDTVFLPNPGAVRERAAAPEAA
jgi:FkbM family methyltransferase